MQRCTASVGTGAARRGSLSVGVLALLAVTEPEALTFFRAVDRGVVDARLFWSDGGWFVGRPLRGKGLGKHMRLTLKRGQNASHIDETVVVGCIILALIVVDA